jgi:preprotein translocase subunit Sec63
MNNPYQILGISQDAGKKEIMDAQMIAMKEKKYPLPEIHSAAKQLLDPARRLAADFMYPVRIKARRPQKITVDIAIPNIDIDEISDNSFDSLT